MRAAAAIALGVALLAVGGCDAGAPPAAYPFQAGSPWPKFRGDERQTGFAALQPQPGGRSFAFPTGQGIFSSPVVGADGTIYVGSADRTFYALDPAGQVRWKVLTGDIIDSAALLDDRGRVYFGSGDGTLRALDAATGAPVWTFTADDPAGNHAFIRWFEGNVGLLPDGRLVAPNDNFFTYALERDSGAVAWRFKTGDQTWSLPAVDPRSGRLYLGNNNVLSVFGSNVYGLRPDGTVDWDYVALGSVAASPLLAGDLVVVGSFDGYLRAFEAATGNVRWEVATLDHIYASPALLSDGTVVQPSADGMVYGVQILDGSVRWRYPTGEPIRSSPAVDAEGHIYVGTGEGQLLVLNGDGTLRFALRLIEGDRNDLNSSPALGRDAVYLGGESGEVFSVPYDFCLPGNAGEGDPRCTLPTAAPPAPITDGATLTYTTPFGGARPAGPDTIDPNQPLAFTLRAWRGGAPIIPVLDASQVFVTVLPDTPVSVDVSGDGKFVTVTPSSGFTARPDGALTITVSAFYLVDTDRRGLKVSGGHPGGVATTTITARLAPPASPPPTLVASTALREATTTWEMSRLAIPLPTLLPSYDQIGFDSLRYRIGLVEWIGQRGVAWMVGARLAEGEQRVMVDPATRTLLPLEVALDGGGFLTLSNQSGLKVVINNIEIPFNRFRVAAALDGQGRSPLARITGSTRCALITLYGGFLEQLGLCNPITDLLTIHGASDFAPAAAADTVGPAAASVGKVSWAANHAGVTATIAGGALPASERLVAILLVDSASGSPVAIDYGARTTRAIGGDGLVGSVTLAFQDGDRPRAEVRAYLMVDAYPVAHAILEIP